MITLWVYKLPRRTDLGAGEGGGVDVSYPLSFATCSYKEENQVLYNANKYLQ